MIKRFLRRTRTVIKEKILGVHDTPTRIAWGTALGMFIAWTPTIGFQIMIYVACAALLRANKTSGIPLLFISNPISAFPLYFFAWKVGSYALHGNAEGSELAELALEQQFEALAQQDVWSRHFWETIGGVLIDLGAELWLGSCIIGICTAIPTYLMTYRAVNSYRARRLSHSEKEEP